MIRRRPRHPVEPSCSTVGPTYAASLQGTPTTDDFVAFGRLSTLERLRSLVAAANPEEAAPLRLALRRLRREKRQGRSQALTGRPRGPQCTRSVAAGELPAEWPAQLSSMESDRRRMDRGFLVDEDRAPPSMKQIAGTRYTLRALAFACREAGLPCRLDIAAIVAWLDAAERRGCRPSGLSAQIGQLRTFATFGAIRSPTSGNHFVV